MKARTRKLLSAAAGVVLATATSAKAEEACKGEPGYGAAKLTVEATGLHSADGEVAVTVYPNDEYRFMAPGGKLARVRTPAVRPATRACFWLPPGPYAVAIYHDEDGDHTFARDSSGRPAEGFGFSNDAPAARGLPPLSAARFRLPPGGLTMRIRMRYLN